MSGFVKTTNNNQQIGATGGTIICNSQLVLSDTLYCNGSIVFNTTLYCLTAPFVNKGNIYTQNELCNQSGNNLSMDYSTGGLTSVWNSLTANATLNVTNLPSNAQNSYTFSVAYQQNTTRYYISTVQIKDTANTYVTNGGASGFVAPLFNGGTPSLTGSTNCLIIQDFTIMSVQGIFGQRYVTSKITCYY